RRAEIFRDALGGARHIVGPRDVASHRQRAAAGLLDECRGLADLRLRAREDRDVEPALRELDRDRTPDPPARSRHDADHGACTKEIASARAASSTPRIAKVTSLAPCVRSPRATMQACVISMRHATHRGARFFSIARTTPSPIASCSVSRRANASSKRAIAPTPKIFPRGAKPTVAFPTPAIK